MDVNRVSTWLYVQNMPIIDGIKSKPDTIASKPQAIVIPANIGSQMPILLLWTVGQTCSRPVACHILRPGIRNQFFRGTTQRLHLEGMSICHTAV
jgi:hypothetical protein